MEKPPTASEAPSLGDDNPLDPSQIDTGLGHNSSDISWPPRSAAGAPLVRVEEALIVLIVLVLWGAAIALFFNRWGKIRMLEPYQPKFQQQQHRASCPMLEIAGTQHRTLSKFNLNSYSGSDAVYSSLMGRSNSNRPRQNSVFAGSSCLVSAVFPPPPRRAKSAMDLQRLLQNEDESPFPYRQRKSSILPPVPPPLPPLPPPPILLPLASPALLRVTNV